MRAKGKRFFFEKNTKKLLLIWIPEVHARMAQIKKSLFASFSSEKAVLLGAVE
jgi:hypothetical protein